MLHRHCKLLVYIILVATWSRLWIRFSRSYFYFLFPSLCFFAFAFPSLAIHPFSHFLFFFLFFLFFLSLHVWGFLVPSPHPILSEPYPTCPTYDYPSPLPQSSSTEPEGRKKKFSNFGEPLESRSCGTVLSFFFLYIFPSRQVEYRKNFYDSPSQEEVVESWLGRKSRDSERVS
ncbi:hypothetical protein B9Z19DRAFT_59799 [Tuber borchii]|uniref:Uncharacterized protein n=1 Tax=Tuber borchii TaxID=42251 RepID=A0A2T6ZSZ2_TUBBO|nr:hypothetical protein B9Z19DRAFT_59799 [Tuber borchii]